MKHSHHAFSLVETALALGIVTIALVPILGLLPVGVNTNQNAINQTAAANLSSQVVADLMGAPSTSGTSAFFTIPITSGTTTRYYGDAGTSGTSANALSRYRITVILNGAGPIASGSGPLTGRILITWPPTLSPTSAPGSYENFIAF